MVLHCPLKCCIVNCRRQFVPSAFRKLVPPRCNRPHLTFQPLDFTSSSLSFSLVHVRISLSFSPFLFLSGYPVERARYPFRADIPWRIPGTKAATIPREYVGETRNVKRVRPILPPPPFLLHLPVLHLCLSFSSASICISFSLIVYHPPPSLSLSFLFLFSSSCLSHNLPIHRKVVVPGMRLIPREYQELSKRTEVGWAMPLSRRRWCGCCWWDRFFFRRCPRDPKARTRRSAFGDEINATTHETLRSYIAHRQMLPDPTDLSPFVR